MESWASFYEKFDANLQSFKKINNVWHGELGFIDASAPEKGSTHRLTLLRREHKSELNKPVTNR